MLNGIGCKCGQSIKGDHRTLLRLLLFGGISGGIFLRFGLDAAVLTLRYFGVEGIADLAVILVEACVQQPQYHYAAHDSRREHD